MSIMKVRYCFELLNYVLILRMQDLGIIQGKLSIESFPTNTKNLSGLLTISFKKIQHFKDMPFLYYIQRKSI